MEVDVLIVGGGPAGLIAATVLAGRGRQVLVVDRGGRPWPHGELLSASGAAMLDEIDHRLFNPASHLNTSRHRSDWGVSRTMAAMTGLRSRGSAWHLDRRSFDADLERVAVDRGAIIKRGVILKSSSRCAAEDVWEIVLNDGSTCTAKLAIDATGRNASFARRNGARRIVLDRMLATAAIVDSATLECEFCIQSRPDGWWYAAMMPGGRVIACLLSETGALPNNISSRRHFWLRQLLEAQDIRDYVVIPKTFELQTSPAGTEYLDSAIGDGWLAIGDAAFTIDPLASAGITIAIKTGRMAAITADATLAGERRLLGAYRSYVRQMVENADILRRAYYETEQRWNSPFWRRRQSGRTVAPPTL